MAKKNKNKKSDKVFTADFITKTIVLATAIVNLIIALLKIGD